MTPEIAPFPDVRETLRKAAQLSKLVPCAGAGASNARAIRRFTHFGFTDSGIQRFWIQRFADWEMRDSQIRR